MSGEIEITLFTDPACPFAFSAEPARLRLRWHYGDQLRWRARMIVLTREPGEAEKLAQGAPSLQRRYGMPIDPRPLARPASSEPACRAVVAVRLHAPPAEERLLRGLRVRAMLGGLLDDPSLIAAAARDAGLDPGQLASWSSEAAVTETLRADVAAARSPSPAARALDHRLGGPPDARRYTAPSYEIALAGAGAGAGAGSSSIAIAGLNPIEVYESAIANLAPHLVRRPQPEDVGELLDWAGEPLATAEVALVMQVDATRARAQLSRVATATAAGADFYWALAGGGA